MDATNDPHNNGLGWDIGKIRLDFNPINYGGIDIPLTDLAQNPPVLNHVRDVGNAAVIGHYNLNFNATFYNFGDDSVNFHGVHTNGVAFSPATCGQIHLNEKGGPASGQYAWGNNEGGCPI